MADFEIMKVVVIIFAGLGLEDLFILYVRFALIFRALIIVMEVKIFMLLCVNCEYNS